VKTVLRRPAVAMTAPTSDPEHAPRVSIDGLMIDPSRFEVSLGNDVVELTATEFRLLHFMASNPGRVYTRERLVREARGEEVVILDRNIDVHVRAIRKKLGEDREFIRTVRGVGYRFRDAD
jgi:two-component system phosphate regulon response regulator PhoB